MAPTKPYELIYDREVWRQVLKIGRKYHSLIRREIEAQLRHEPETETRKRKPLLRPSVLGSAWELRFGPENRFRVFYRVNRVLRQVHILAVGVKIKDKLYIGGEEFEL
jgi:hypothetical protein